MKMLPQMNPVLGRDTKTPLGWGRLGFWLGLAGFEGL